MESNYSLETASRKSSHRPLRHHTSLRSSASSVVPAYASSNIKRPMLLRRDYASVHQFMSQWKFYCCRVNTSGMSDKKKKEALNVCTCLTDSVLRSLVAFELPRLHIWKEPATDTSTAVQYRLEDLTPDIVLQWLNAKLKERIGRADMIPLIELMEGEIFGSSKYLFSYQPGEGTLREQLEDHSMLVHMVYEKYGVEDSITDITKIGHWIRLLRPWSMSKHAMLWMAHPDYTFLNTDYHTLTDVLAHYRGFVEETIHVIANYLLPTIGLCLPALYGLNNDPLTFDEEMIIGRTISAILNNASEDNRDEHLLKRKEISDCTTSLIAKKRPKSQRHSLLITNGSADCGDLNDDNEPTTGMICTNCGVTGCFSSRCKNPCKFCNKRECNSWTCPQRPSGYGSDLERHSTPTISTNTGRRSRHGETESD